MLIIPIFIAHQGCPHDCLFCNQQKISGAGRRESLAAGTITQTIEEWLARDSRQKREVQVAFFGGSFTCLPRSRQQSMLAEVAPFLKKGNVHSLRCSTRPDCIDDEVCLRLRQAGVTTVELGIQSMNDTVLRVSRRGHSVKESRDAVLLLKKYGFTVGAQLMPGLPGESCSSFLRGVREILALRPDMLRLYPALVIEDSAMAQLYMRGDYQPLSLDAAVTLCAAANTLAARQGIDVIRMGLQASPSLERSLIAGPYHPAFGELVRSRLWLQRILRHLRQLPQGERVLITVSHYDISAVIGINKENKKRLDRLGYAGRYRIAADRTVEKGSLYVVCQ